MSEAPSQPSQARLVGVHLERSGELFLCRLNLTPPSQNRVVNYVPVNRLLGLGDELVRIDYEQPIEDPWRFVMSVRMPRERDPGDP